jgi:heme/copper-type cytochrome/quinol oxidase subunit 2
LELDINWWNIYYTSITITILTYFYTIYTISKYLKKEFPSEDYTSYLFDNTFVILIITVVPFVNFLFCIVVAWLYYDIRDNLVKSIRNERNTLKKLVEQLREQIDKIIDNTKN